MISSLEATHCRGEAVVVRDVRTSGLAGMERGDGTSCLNVCSCGRGDTSRSGDTTVRAVGHMPRVRRFPGVGWGGTADDGIVIESLRQPKLLLGSVIGSSRRDATVDELAPQASTSRDDAPPADHCLASW